MPNPNLKKVALLSVVALIAQIVLSRWIYPLFGQTTQTLFSIQPASGIGGQVVGNKVLGYLTGFIPFDISNYAVWIAMYIGAFALVYAGMLIYENRFVKLWQGKNLTQRLFAILLYGHVVLYLVLLALKWGTVPGIVTGLLVGLGINLLLVSALVALSAKYLNVPKI